MNTLIIIEAVLIIKGETTVQLRISAVLLRKAGRWDVPYAAGSDGNLFELLALVESILADHGDVVSDGNSGEPRFVFEGISPD